MFRIIRRSSVVLFLGLMCSGAWLLPGCAEEAPKRKYRVLEGTAEKIDLKTGQVSMNYFSKKRNEELAVEGRITDETEVLINGRLARLEDIRPQEHVRVTGYKEGKGANALVVVTRVEIERPEWSDVGSSSGAATQPAGP